MRNETLTLAAALCGAVLLAGCGAGAPDPETRTRPAALTLPPEQLARVKVGAVVASLLSALGRDDGRCRLRRRPAPRRCSRRSRGRSPACWFRWGRTSGQESRSPPSPRPISRRRSAPTARGMRRRAMRGASRTGTGSSSRTTPSPAATWSRPRPTPFRPRPTGIPLSSSSAPWASEEAALEDIRQGRAVATAGGAIRSPIDGTVVEKLITPGQLLQAGTTPCFTVADLSTVWVMANIFESNLPLVAVGDPAEITTGASPEALPGNGGLHRRPRGSRARGRSASGSWPATPRGCSRRTSTCASPSIRSATAPDCCSRSRPCCVTTRSCLSSTCRTPTAASAAAG